MKFGNVERDLIVSMTLRGLLCFCQAQPRLQVKLSLKAELALFSFDPALIQHFWLNSGQVSLKEHSRTNLEDNLNVFRQIEANMKS